LTSRPAILPASWCLTLRVIEVRGNGDDRFRHFLAKIGLGAFLHLLKDRGADLFRRILLP
jgi:hypothetical protein